MLLLQHARRQALCGVIASHRHSGLHDDGAMIHHRRDEVHGAAVNFNPGFERAAMRGQARKCRQQRGMDVDQAARVVLHKAVVRMRMKPASTTKSGA